MIGQRRRDGHCFSKMRTSGGKIFPAGVLAASRTDQSRSLRLRIAGSSRLVNCLKEITGRSAIVFLKSIDFAQLQ